MEFYSADQRLNKSLPRYATERVLSRTTKQIKTELTMKKQIQFLILTGWLLPVGVALLYFARWIREIVVPTLKGGNFDQLYDMHQVRYLDTTLACTVVAFAWATVAVV